jgi:hypothetical protein
MVMAIMSVVVMMLWWSCCYGGHDAMILLSCRGGHALVCGSDDHR